MYGLEKSPGEKFNFDLEVDLKKDPKKAKELLKKIETNIQEIKKSLREGSDAKELDDLGTLLHGYEALEKVLKKASKE